MLSKIWASKPLRFYSMLLLFLVGMYFIHSQPCLPEKGLAKCSKIEDADKRLACYDKLAKEVLEPPAAGSE
jgi:hypothetical protein